MEVGAEIVKEESENVSLLFSGRLADVLVFSNSRLADLSKYSNLRQLVGAAGTTFLYLETLYSTTLVEALAAEIPQCILQNYFRTTQCLEHYSNQTI